MSQPIELALSAFAPYKKSGRNYRVRCPGPNHANGDRHPSLDISEGKDGRVLFYCQSGQCHANLEHLIAAKGLSIQDIHPERSIASTGRLDGLPSLKDRPHYNNSTRNCHTAKPIRTTADVIEEALKTVDDPVIGRRASEIEQEEIDWLWEGMIPLGMLSLIDGAEGVGKTWIILALAACTTTGRGFYGTDQAKRLSPATVILVTPEDSAAAVLKPRLAMMGAAMSKVIIVDEPVNLSTPAGVLSLRRACIEHNPSLIVFDPMNANVGGIDINQDNQVRAITSQLKAIAEEYNTAIVMVRHIGKSKGQGNSRNAGLGSVAWRASARMSFIVGQNPENAAERAMATDKNNLLPEKPRSIGYRITSQGLCWTGESKLTVEQMLSFKAQETHHERSAREEAQMFLKDFLRKGPKEPIEIFKAAKVAGLSESTVNRAKADLAIKPRKNGLGPWTWSYDPTNPGQ